MEKIVQIPENVEISIENSIVAVKGPLGELKRTLKYPGISIKYDSKQRTIKISTESKRRKDISILGTFASHINNMIQGAQKEFVYEMKCVYAHFPMTIKVQGQEVLIQNFLGERQPRKVKIKEGVKIKVEGDSVFLSGCNKEVVSQSAAKLESACYKGNRDPRKFQDGIYPVGWKNE